MEGVAEGGHEMDIASRGQDTANLMHGMARIADVFEDRITLDPLKDVGWKR